MTKVRSKLWGNLALVSVSTLLCLVAIEVGLRAIQSVQAPITLKELEARRKEFEGRETGLGHMIMASRNPRRVYEFIPNLRVLWHGHEVRINSNGFRGDDFVQKKPADTIRIAVIGDSVSFGWKVDERDNYPEVLEQFLNRFSKGPRFEVMNFSIPGYNSCMEREVLQTKALALDPDVVLLQFSGNDMDLPNFLKIPENHWRLDRCYLWEFISTRRLRLGRKQTEGSAIEKAGLLFAPEGRDEHGNIRFVADESHIPPELRDMVGEENCKAAIRDIGRLCKSKGIQTVFLLNVNVAEYYSEEKPATQDLLLAPFVEVARQEGFAVADPTVAQLEFLRRHGLQSRDLWVDPSIMDAHPTPPRHSLIAMQVAKVMLENDTLPASAVHKSQQAELLAAFLRHADWELARMKRLSVPRIAENAVTIMPTDARRESDYLAEGWYAREKTSRSGEVFRWCKPQAKLRLPPARRLVMEVGIHGLSRLGPPDQTFVFDGQPLPYRLTQSSGRVWFDIVMPETLVQKATSTINLTIQCKPLDMSQLPEDRRRPLGLQVFRIVIEPL